MGSANQYDGSTNAKAQSEIQIMRCLRIRPQTPAEISKATGLPNKRIRYLLQGLRTANCIGKVRGSHAVRLLSV